MCVEKLDPDGWSVPILKMIEKAEVESDEDHDGISDPPAEAPSSPVNSTSTMDVSLLLPLL